MNQLDQLRRLVPQVSAAELCQITRGPCSSIVLLDVRENHEVAQGVIPRAAHIPLGYVEATVEDTLTDKSAAIYIYCASGMRSLLAAKMLLDRGYKTVYNVSDGYIGYLQSLEQSGPSRERYERQIVLPGVGLQGQLKLDAAKVLLIGAGGIGSPAALYLAGAGVGTIGLIDFDVVERSNLQRQVLFGDADVGQPKVAVAAERVNALNPEVQVDAIMDRLNKRNAREIISAYDLVVDGSDNFETRYLVNDTCISLNKTFVHASVYRWEGLVSVFGAQDGPCYRCLFPTPPPDDSMPNCAIGGVLGATVGVVGSLAAAEVVKLILGVGETLSGVVLKYNALNANWSRVSIAAHQECECRA